MIERQLTSGNYKCVVAVTICFPLLLSVIGLVLGQGGDPRKNTNSTTTTNPGSNKRVWTKQQPPTFSDFPASVVKATARQINLSSHPKARMFRTNLRESLSEGVDFAGRYIVATWGCGTDCQGGAIIDGKTGNVFFPKQLQGTSLGSGDFAEEVVEYKENSRLLIINGYPGGGDGKYGIWYYEWTGTTLELLKFVKKSQSPGQ